MTFFFWILGIVVYLALIYVTFMMARVKGRSPFLWLILAIFFPLIALLIVAFLPTRRGAPGY